MDISPRPNSLARYSERRKKTRQVEEETGRQYQEMDRPGEFQMAVENREKWRKLVVKSSVVRQRAPRLGEERKCVTPTAKQGKHCQLTLEYTLPPEKRTHT